jgi:hypothetical protein
MSQEVHADAPAPEYVPPEHWEQLVVEAEYVPAVHCVGVLTPVPTHVLPAGHATHPVPSEEYVPEAQDKHNSNVQRF